MKHIKKTNILPKLPDMLMFHPEKALFLDIETTGFSGVKNRLYLIGTAYIQNKELLTEQFFAETPDEEAQLLAAFGTLLQQFDTVVTFHGNRFDLPFLEKCRKRLQVGQVYHNKNYVDLYELANSYRHVFGLENCKQKTLESFLGTERKDIYSGGELVKVYQAYSKQPQEDSAAILLQHNEDDLAGMLQLLSLYLYDGFFNGGFSPAGCRLETYRKPDGSEGKELSAACRLDAALPAPISCNNGCLYLHAEKGHAYFRIPLFEGSLKYFYPNYKDYYYLPEEDTALHKSVASYVDPAHRQKAKAANCYSKKTGRFLPQYEEIITPAFFTEYKAAVSYFEWKDGYAQDKILLKQYCMHLLDILKKGS